ncbi:MAG: response regulator [Akkermansiaceae bacterium]|nr:response regulator [Verrucomicrobiales bacterium]
MKRILLIEDDQVFGNIYRNKLLLEGFQVELARDGETGFDLILQFRPDVVLMDLVLPKMTGIDLLKKIRAVPEFGQLPVIVLTNAHLSSMLQDAWKAGATKCLTKASCTPNQVIDTINRILTPVPTAPPVAIVTEAPTHTGDSSHPQTSPPPTGVTIPELIGELRLQLQNLFKITDETRRAEQIDDMARKVNVLASNSNIAGFSRISQLAHALENLLKELFEKPQSINASTLRTVALAIDCLSLLYGQPELETWDISQARLLVVDDESISRRAVTHALDKAKLHSVSIEDPLKAFDLLALKKFDLVFLDVDMPNMNGYELCTKIRTLPAYKKTPVVFVTGLNDFEARANSTMSGGNDFIAKPFLFIELAVKALIHLLRSQLQPAKK